MKEVIRKLAENGIDRKSRFFNAKEWELLKSEGSENMIPPPVH